MAKVKLGRFKLTFVIFLTLALCLMSFTIGIAQQRNTGVIKGICPRIVLAHIAFIFLD